MFVKEFYIGGAKKMLNVVDEFRLCKHILKYVFQHKIQSVQHCNWNIKISIDMIYYSYLFSFFVMLYKIHLVFEKRAIIVEIFLLKDRIIGAQQGVCANPSHPTSSPQVCSIWSSKECEE